ncbi:DUF3450 domain-containing protein [Catenovulum maritimum]|uniref:Energy transducer TonB n=1 Tax=Catenovulum maritimum TaxID=1513271 RepID=A0A0J8JJI0_9ALTE|nr:DUF3450 domain-containing protein [Catenovulum maritimum]KMT64596.1 energy transducer TonB [Catenovulum maritimum]
MSLSRTLKVTVKTSVIATAIAMSTFTQANSLKPAINASKQINQSAEKSQQKIDSISDDIQTRLEQFKAINKEIEGLEIYNKQVSAQISDQEATMQDINDSIDKISVVERQVMPLMTRMIDGLEQFIALDVPFLKEERSERIASLKKMMSSAGSSPADKFRRVLEAYTIELDYGNTIEAYTSTLEVDGVERDVDFLRVGRVAFIYQTKDGKQSGVWQADKNEFVALSSDYRTKITKALRIARKQLAPDLLSVPLLTAKNVAAE